MTSAYVDSSCIIAIMAGEPGWKRVARRLAAFDRLCSSNLLEAEVQSVMARDGLERDPGELLAALDWILPVEPLTDEIERVLAKGYLRGADLWHLACALHFAPDPTHVSFLSLDEDQAGIARALGFRD